MGERVAQRAIGTSFCKNYNSIARDVILLQNNTVLLNAKNYKKYITQDGPLCNISFSKDCLNGPSSLQRTAYPDDYTHLQMFNFFRLALLQVQVANRDDLQKKSDLIILRTTAGHCE